MTRKELDKLIGKKVAVITKSGNTYIGILGFASDFSEKYGYRKPNHYYVDTLTFKVSHIKKVKVLNVKGAIYD